MQVREKSPTLKSHLELSTASMGPIQDYSEVPLLKTIRSSNIRWLILILSIITSYGSYFCFDSPQPLQYDIKKIFAIQDTQFNLLNSITLLPNTIFPLIGGLVIDSKGIRVAMMITGTITALGQLIIALGASLYCFEILLIGRFVFGLGSVTLENSLLNIIAKWFLSRELTLSWGIARALLRTSTALNSFLTPRLYTWTHQLYIPFFFGFIITLISLIAVFTVCYLDKKAEEQHEVNSPRLGEKISFKHLKKLPMLFFLVMTLGVLVYMSFHGFTNNVNNLLITRFGFTSTDAGSMITVIYLVAAVVCPFVGYAVDRVGKRVFFLSVAMIFIFLANIYFLFLGDRRQGFENHGVVLGFISFGLFYALFSTVLWTSFALIVAPPYLGTATGIVACLIAVFQTIFPEVLGLIHDNTIESHHGYYFTQIAHCGVIFLCILMVLWIYYEDKQTNRRLERIYFKAEGKQDMQ